jgi:hypothetical protein
MLIAQAAGGYRFLPGIAPYSSGVVADGRHEVIHATLAAPVPWRRGFERIDAHLRRLGRPRAALCAVALRSPAPFSFAGFADFNRGYREVLDAWGLPVDGRNPVARTNVAPVVGPLAEPSLHAFAYTVPAAPGPGPTFVVAGAGELRPGAAGPEGIVRGGETSAAALRDKVRFVVDVMTERLVGLGAAWGDVTAVDVYTARDVGPLLETEILARVGPAAAHGIRWYLSRPPIEGLDFEMDLRGVRTEVVLPEREAVPAP